ncbi:MAG: amidohydrolase family protein [Polyangiaceae bacterium]|nr:amidohydrolase family protein [Polyangiaceae bacterium]
MATLRFPIHLVLGSIVAVGCTQEWVATPSNPLPVLGTDDEQKPGGNGGAGGSGGAGAGAGGTGAFGGACMPNPGAPEVVKVGVPGKMMLIGCVVTPEGPVQGSVFIKSDTIQCVGASCTKDADAFDATVIETHGVIMPGMIDTHNHILFDIFDEDDWSPSKPYSNHDQWPQEARYGAMVDAKQYLNNEVALPPEHGGAKIPEARGCEMNKYGEMKALVAGTTSVVGAANPLDKICYGSLARTIDQKPNDLPEDKIQVATLTPSSETANSVCMKFADDVTDAYVIHRGEGVDEYSRAEFDKLGELSTDQPGCLYAPETTIVHGTAFGEAEFKIMADKGMSLVWSPRSNVFLYGAGTDYTKTTDVEMALGLGINVALAPDWSLGGSQNLLDEMRFADEVDKNRWKDELLSSEMLVQMVTINAAKALGLQDILGSLEVGKKADVTVISGDVTQPYDAIVAARPNDVSLVVVNGIALYGDAALVEVGPKLPGCEALDICGTPKFACVAEATGTATDKLKQTWAEITTTLTTELEAYDALDITQWDFAPLTPLVKCE